MGSEVSKQPGERPYRRGRMSKSPVTGTWRASAYYRKVKEDYQIKFIRWNQLREFAKHFNEDFDLFYKGDGSDEFRLRRVTHSSYPDCCFNFMVEGIHHYEILYNSTTNFITSGRVPRIDKFGFPYGMMVAIVDYKTYTKEEKEAKLAFIRNIFDSERLRRRNQRTMGEIIDSDGTATSDNDDPILS